MAEMAHGPFEQFELHSFLKMDIMGVDISFTNASLFMMLVSMLIMSVYFFGFRRAQQVPGRLQNMGEMLYLFVDKMLFETCGAEGKKNIPYVFSIFTFVLFCNLLGMIPYGYTVTSQIIVSFALAISIFIIITIIAFMKHGVKFFGFFLPSGTPLWMAPLMVFIEFFTYLSRPFSLCVRLTANMIAGHVLLKVLAGFVIMMGLVFGFVPIPLIVVIIGFEIFIALLQAYIFTILSCVYLNDALHMH